MLDSFLLNQKTGFIENRVYLSISQMQRIAYASDQSIQLSAQQEQHLVFHWCFTVAVKSLIESIYMCTVYTSIPMVQVKQINSTLNI